MLDYKFIFSVTPNRTQIVIQPYASTYRTLDTFNVLFSVTPNRTQIAMAFVSTLQFFEELHDPTSAKFAEYKELFENELTDLFKSVPGFKEAVVKFFA